MKCTKCSKVIKKDSKFKFCTNCGLNIKKQWYWKFWRELSPEEKGKYIVGLAVLIIIGIFVWSIAIGSLFSVGSQKSIQSNLILGQKTISLYVEFLPYGVDRTYVNVVREAESGWEKANPQLNFKETDDSRNANVNVQWIKEFGGHPLGQAIRKDIIQIGLGDSNCLGKWKPYTYDTVLSIAEHELGHILGLSHSTDPTSVMYESISTKYETDIEENDVLPDGWYRYYPVCTKNIRAVYSIEITSNVPLDIFGVASKEDYELLSNEKNYRGNPDCQTKEIMNYRKTCILTIGSGIVLRNPSTFGLGEDAQFNIKIKEL